MYLDPGFGIMVIQLLIGGIAAIGAGFFMFRQKIKEFFGIRFSKKAAEETSDNKEQENKENQ